MQLFALIEEIVAADPRDLAPLANALCSCFLEAIAGTEAGEASQPLIGPVSHAHFAHWLPDPR